MISEERKLYIVRQTLQRLCKAWAFVWGIWSRRARLEPVTACASICSTYVCLPSRKHASFQRTEPRSNSAEFSARNRKTVFIFPFSLKPNKSNPELRLGERNYTFEKEAQSSKLCYNGRVSRTSKRQPTLGETRQTPSLCVIIVTMVRRFKDAGKCFRPRPVYN